MRLNHDRGHPDEQFVDGFRRSRDRICPKARRFTGSTQSAGASLSHSALKGATLKVATSITNFAVLSLATGGIVGGTALMLFNAASSWAIYTANDYAWDSYEPAPVRQDANQSFDATADAWRNTK
jgi:hypothetical protein